MRAVGRLISDVVTPLRDKLRERLRELLLTPPIVSVDLEVDYEQTFMRHAGCFLLYVSCVHEGAVHRERYVARFEIPWHDVQEATPEPDEPPPDFVSALRSWRERDEPRRKERERHVTYVVRFVRKELAL